MSEDTNPLKPEDLIGPMNTAYANFDREIERLPDISKSLEEGETHLLELRNLRIKYLGKKSELAIQKKLIRRIDRNRSGEAGSNIQTLDQDIRQRIVTQERGLKHTNE